MITAIGDVVREAYKRNWITTRDGNISIRKGKNFYITPSGWRKNIICPELIIKAQIEQDLSLTWPYARSNAQNKLSGELEMHRLLQTTDWNKSSARAVVHLHPTHIVAAMYRGFNLQKLAKDFPEVFRYTKVGPNVEKLPATSEALANATLNAMTSNNKLIYTIVGQANHGVCSIGDNPWDAFEHIERLDHICQIVLKSGVSP